MRTGARLVFVCDPNNPTGLRIGADEWRAFLDAVGPDCVVVADEAYMDYVEPDRPLRREDDVADGRRVVVLRTFSKIFGLAGLRLGYLLADPALVHYLHSVQEPFNVNRAALAAGVASLGRPGELAERRELAAACAGAARERAARWRDGARPVVGQLRARRPRRRRRGARRAARGPRRAHPPGHGAGHAGLGADHRRAEPRSWTARRRRCSQARAQLLGAGASAA